MSDKIGEVIEVTNRNTSVLKTLAYKSIDIESRSCRNNLIFWGLSENYNDKRAMMALGRSPEYHWNQIISISFHRLSRKSRLKLFFY